MCELLLSGFADETSTDKSIDQQFTAFAAMGLKFVSLRFLDVGTGIKNIIDLDHAELAIVQSKLKEYELSVSSIGSPIGKTKLFNIEDGTQNSYFELEDYLTNQVSKVCQVANLLDCKLIRGFSFYHPKGKDPAKAISASAERLTEIVKMCDHTGLTFGLEVEANLVGQNAEFLLQIHEQVNSEAMALIFDGANLVTQGYSRSEIIKQFNDMKHAIGWIHIKDHLPLAGNTKGSYVDEEALHQFVPAGKGESGYPEILESLQHSFDSINQRMKSRGIPGVFADLEPHLKGGGQFGGFSGPDGFGIATRAFCQLCDQANINYQLRDRG